MYKRQPLPFANPWDCPGHFSPSESVSDPDHFVREASMQQWRRLNRDCAASVPPAASLSFQPVDTLRRSNSAPPCRPPAPHQAPTLHANDTYGVSSNACALSLDHVVSQVHGTPRGQLYNFHSTEVGTPLAVAYLNLLACFTLLATRFDRWSCTSLPSLTLVENIYVV